MQETVLISMPVEELQSIITNCVKDCLKYPPVQERKETLLTEQQAASFLNIPDATLQALINKCEIPIRIKGKRCYFSIKDLEAWQLQAEKEVVNGK
jgi:hypothetical protein